MSRPARVTSQDILDAALAVVGREGRDNVSIAAIAAELGAPTGSLYHRFGSRDELLVRLWVRSVQRFQVGYLAACALDDLGEALHGASLHMTAYCRAEPSEAQALTLFRHAVLCEHDDPVIRELVGPLNDDAIEAATALCHRRYGTVTPELMAILDAGLRTTGYGLIRPALAERRPIPLWVDDAIVAAQDAVLAVGDRLAGGSSVSA